MDRGYLDFRRLFQMHQAGAFFVIRANSLEAENTALADLACVSPASDGDNLYFEGCNVHVRNGNGTTNTHNGYGNPIVGYDEADQSGLVPEVSPQIGAPGRFMAVAHHGRSQPIGRPPRCSPTAA